MFGGFSAVQLKPQLKMASGRIQIASNKKAALQKQNKREVAVLLAETPPREEKAKIRAEALIRDDNMIEAYEILQLECDLLHERMKLIEYTKDCPPDLVPVISTVIWASQRVDIPELVQARKQFRAKYGKKFEEAALANEGGVLNERVVSKLSVEPPPAYMVQAYLERICEEYEVKWRPQLGLTAAEMVQPMRAPDGYSVAVGQGSGLGPVPPPGSTMAASTYGNGVDDPAYMKQFRDSIPPPIVATATVLPMPPTVPLSGATTGLGGVPPRSDDFDEPEIFVPGPQKPPSSSSSQPYSLVGTASAPGVNGHDDRGEDGGATLGHTAPGPPTNSATYEDLASRFDKLNKK